MAALEHLVGRELPPYYRSWQFRMRDLLCAWAIHYHWNFEIAIPTTTANQIADQRLGQAQVSKETQDQTPTCIAADSVKRGLSASVKMSVC